MTGNVAEWCEDYLGLYSPARQVDPRGPSKGYQRVVKGGSYKDDPEMMRNSFRGHMRAYDKAPTVGLRLVHDAK
jgi:formylglycine-generating enzyme required for sulfatase activity